jgi:cytoskeletal protein CcmA (bactofilin family)
MQSTSGIGPSITITGDLTADEPLTIAGRVDGTVSVTGHSVTIDDSGHVNADLQADIVIVSGHVTGSLAATTRIVVRESAVVDGSLSAPVLSVVEGAQLSGKVDVTGHKNGTGLKLAS